MYPRGNILGVGVSAIRMQEVVETIASWIDERKRHYVCVTPAHGVMEAQRNPELRHIFNQSGLTTPDGMGIVWLLRFLGHYQVERVYGPDLMLALCERSELCGWRHYLYGGVPGVAEILAEKLQLRFPGLQIVGTCSPPFGTLAAEEERAIADKINDLQPHIIWVGISTPKQEFWMAKNADRLNAYALIGVGAAFDFLSGVKRQAPRWIQHSGFEWLFRLANEPRRLWRRYLQYTRFLLLVGSQLAGLRHFPLD